MTISYTDEMKLALLDSGSGNWGAVINGLLTLVDAGYEVTLNAGADLSAAQYKVVYIDASNSMQLAKADADATMPAVGILPNNVAVGIDGKVRVSGWINNGGWTWTVGAKLYVSAGTAGALTETAPSPRAQCIAIAKTATKILIIPSLYINNKLATKTKKIRLGVPRRWATAAGSHFQVVNTENESVGLYFSDLAVGALSFQVPDDWDGASDMNLVLVVQNRIAETDGDIIDFDCEVWPMADGTANAAATGQDVDMSLTLTGGTEANNMINFITGVIDYNHGSYPLAIDDWVKIYLTANMGGGGAEITGPLFVLDAWIEYTAVTS